MRIPLRPVVSTIVRQYRLPLLSGIWARGAALLLFAAVAAVAAGAAAPSIVRALRVGPAMTLRVE